MGKLGYSYSFGMYPTLDLLLERPKSVLKVVFKGEVINEIKDLCEKNDIPFEVNGRLVEKIAFRENTKVVGIFEKYGMNLNQSNNHLVLYQPNNTGNVGTVIRSMVGFGVRDLAIIRPGVDIWYPKVISSTMGAFFKVNIEYFDSWDDYAKKFERNYYPFMLNGKSSLKDVEFKKPFSLIHGSEGNGLPKEFDGIGESVYIPHGKDIESLNLSVAVGISLWESCEDEEFLDIKKGVEEYKQGKGVSLKSRKDIDKFLDNLSE